MADVKKIKLPDNSVYNIKDYRIPGVDTVPTSGSGNVITSGGVYKDTRYEAGEVIIGTQTGATGSWTGVSRLATATDFKSGYRFTYWLPYAGDGNATLTLTFQDNTTKTINLYYSASNRLTTHISAGNKIDFLYLENANVAGTTYTGAWIDKGYYTTNTYTQNEYYERRYIYSAETPLYRYKLYGYRDGRVVPLTITNQTSATIVNKTPTSVAIEIDKGVGYYGSTTEITSASTVIGAQTQYDENAITTATYTFNTNVPTYVDIYLKGNYENGLFTLDTTSNTSWYVYAPNNSTFDAYRAVFEEGYYYMYIGPSYSTSNYFELKQFNPTYCFDGETLIPIYEKLINDSNFITSTALNDLNKRISDDEVVLTNIGKVTGIALNDLNDRINNINRGINNLSNYDEVPTENSTKAVTSGGLYDVITKNERTVTSALNDLNYRLSDSEDELNNLNDRIDEIQNNSDDFAENIDEIHKVISASLNDLNDRVIQLNSDLNSGLSDTNHLVNKNSKVDELTNAQYIYKAVHPNIITRNSAFNTYTVVPNVLNVISWTVAGTKTFSLDTSSVYYDSNIANHYYWTFNTGATAPTITWPSGLTWPEGNPPTLKPNHHYEISILNNVVAWMEV